MLELQNLYKFDVILEKISSFLHRKFIPITKYGKYISFIRQCVSNDWKHNIFNKSIYRYESAWQMIKTTRMIYKTEDISTIRAQL